MTAAMWAEGLLGATVLLAWWRLGAWWRGASARARPARWRMLMLLLGQPLVAGLLFLTLFPPMMAAPEHGTLTIATRGTPRLAMLADADLVALPEASAPMGTITVPDLATALRSRPGIGRLRILGQGLEPRDIEVAQGLAVDFDPPTAPRGLVALVLPEPVAPGSDFRVGGEVDGMRGTAELLDPGGTRIGLAPLDAKGRFVLTGAARVAGPALFQVRLRDPSGRIVEDEPVPVVTVSDPPPRILFLAGAPGPEVKYWRRWAVDAGLDATVRQSVGGGLTLGGPAPPLGAADLARYDLVVVDDRSWAALGPGERSALVSAVRGGLGLLLRATGPLPADVRAGWAGLGLPVTGGIATAPVRPTDAGEPELTRRVLLSTSSQFVPLQRDAGGTVLTGWHAFGNGRVGVDSVMNEFALVTSGHGDRFGARWGEIVGALSRARPVSAARLEALPQAERRTTICGIADGAKILGPDDRLTTLLSDAAAGNCAGFWPRRAGWHSLRQATSIAFYVYPATALPGIRATECRDATMLLTGTGNAVRGARPLHRSSSLPWLCAFLTTAAVLWWLERSRSGRGRPT